MYPESHLYRLSVVRNSCLSAAAILIGRMAICCLCVVHGTAHHAHCSKVKVRQRPIIGVAMCRIGSDSKCESNIPLSPLDVRLLQPLPPGSTVAAQTRQWLVVLAAVCAGEEVQEGF